MADQISSFDGIIRAVGDRSIAGQSIGAATAGDHSPIINLEWDTLKAPSQVKLAGKMKNLPQAPSAVFVGREDVLAVMTETLTGTSVQMAIGQVIHGMGGIGKSEVARQYIARHSQRYQLVWWITATSDEEIKADLASLAERVHPPLPEALALSTALGVEQAAHWALSWLQAHDDWLLVLDNVEDPKHVSKLLAQLRNGHIVITTRRLVAWPAEVTRLPLDLLAKDAATELIALTSERTIDPRERSAFEVIAAELGYLPLALEQAGAYIRESRISPEEYLSLLAGYPAHMYAASSEGGDAERTIARLWRTHLDAIRERNAYAVRLLQVLACYAPNDIPRSILGADSDRLVVLDALRLLSFYSLITLDKETVSVHRLIQAVVSAEDETRSAIEEDSAPELALAWLADAWLISTEQPPSDRVARRRMLSPHVESLIRHYPVTAEFRENAGIFHAAAAHERDDGNYIRAHRLISCALSISAAALGGEDPRTLEERNNLALLLGRLGRWKESKDEHQVVLQIQEKVLGKMHRTTLTSRSNLAVVLGDLGQLEEAEAENRAVLQARVQVLGEGHPETHISRNNLAHILERKGDLEEAESEYYLAWLAMVSIRGEEHPETLISRNNRASALWRMGRVEEAENESRAVWEVSRRVLGDEHPVTLASRNSRVVLLLEMGRAEEAEKEGYALWEVLRRARGDEHPETLTVRSNRASALFEMGRTEEAEKEGRLVRDAMVRVLGETHPLTLMSQGNLEHYERSIKLLASTNIRKSFGNLEANSLCPCGSNKKRKRCCCESS
ncbi:ATP-binding protein [Acrocarpospora pleiomorpha]|uniref:ATP-binding protein n=1 Tax=Acrocarpospora pleiomorpha TaxID=90975 RepID=A0A5M3Y3L6_9ACTN|nr:tetratricopeptide repeat protein [Acrocarpospora pleiomorpha]GES25498.1 ATP-binding protein [Acrocarpospora pleiomorpha]